VWQEVVEQPWLWETRGRGHGDSDRAGGHREQQIQVLSSPHTAHSTQLHLGLGGRNSVTREASAVVLCSVIQSTISAISHGGFSTRSPSCLAPRCGLLREGQGAGTQCHLHPGEVPAATGAGTTVTSKDGFPEEVTLEPDAKPVCSHSVCDTGSRCAAWVNPPSSVSPVAGITGVHCHARLCFALVTSVGKQQNKTKTKGLSRTFSSCWWLRASSSGSGCHGFLCWPQLGFLAALGFELRASHLPGRRVSRATSFAVLRRGLSGWP
jgi:hypothetical protein